MFAGTAAFAEGPSFKLFDGIELDKKFAALRTIAVAMVHEGVSLIAIRDLVEHALTKLGGSPRVFDAIDRIMDEAGQSAERSEALNRDREEELGLMGRRTTAVPVTNPMGLKGRHDPDAAVNDRIAGLAPAVAMGVAFAPSAIDAVSALPPIKFMNYAEGGVANQFNSNLSISTAALDELDNDKHFVMKGCDFDNDGVNTCFKGPALQDTNLFDFNGPDRSLEQDNMGMDAPAFTRQQYPAPTFGL
jgi:hypothetical protein